MSIGEQNPSGKISHRNSDVNSDLQYDQESQNTNNWLKLKTQLFNSS